MRLRVDRIRTDGGTQPRAAMDEATIADYAEAIESGVTMPPVVVFHDGEVYWLADGYHRLAATKRLGCLDIDVDLRQGTRRDAMLHSFGANATHGLRRTNADKRRAVMAMLSDPDWSQWSNREIARAVNVSEWNVRRIRAEVTPPSMSAICENTQIEPAEMPATRTVRRGDTEYEMRVDAINAERPRAAPPAADFEPPRAPAPADPDAALASEVAQFESEVLGGEVATLRAQLVEARDTIAVLTTELEILSRGVDGDLLTEIKKQAVYIRALERGRDDAMVAANALKAEIKRLQRLVQRTTAVNSHG